eukprot:TRINITY_DN16081_c0_g1_i1.p1 TRINITY_DN16081_c0_g1~~TRINITY_DN16081_c0_g1_i1.p1  ORF type:complete len:107 (-),score=32.14 TRINITY_DN16081_c0_g1_i1:24-344(-)
MGNKQTRSRGTSIISNWEKGSLDAYFTHDNTIIWFNMEITEKELEKALAAQLKKEKKREKEEKESKELLNITEEEQELLDEFGKPYTAPIWTKPVSHTNPCQLILV